MISVRLSPALPGPEESRVRPGRPAGSICRPEGQRTQRDCESLRRKIKHDQRSPPAVTVRAPLADIQAQFDPFSGRREAGWMDSKPWNLYIYLHKSINRGAS